MSTLGKFNSQFGGNNPTAPVRWVTRDSNLHAIQQDTRELDVRTGSRPQKTLNRGTSLNRSRWIIRSLPNNLHDDPLFPLSIELGIENSLPRSQIQLAFGDGQGH